MTTSTHSHKAWTDEGGHVKVAARRRATAHLAQAHATAAAGGPIHRRAQAQGAAGGRNLSGRHWGANQQRGAGQQECPKADGAPCSQGQEL